MSNFDEIMGELLELGTTANPACPYAACIIDGSGQVLVTACNAMHISPLYSAESLALHIIASEFDCKTEQPLILVSTGELDDPGLHALYRARRKGINITELVFGASRSDIKSIWPEDPNRPLSESLAQFPESFRNSITIHDPVLQQDCREAFAEGHEIVINGQAPVKNLDIDQYWMAGDWLLDDWDNPDFGE